ncbi:unnamed protein product [Cylicocyclus nassatus]|uniref:Acyltransferase n=1 Tax=Cylicocyclus nassatus TaxID=53992 RepID=A0AA36M5K7_CYLNA|nr:unnamed protein product [Cylicocyclus nassatus]
MLSWRLWSVLAAFDDEVKVGTDKALVAELSSTDRKRQDIQGIRAWAIFMVVAFHFFPTYCPNGYVGVDMFFVVSGFLMAMIITRASPMSASSLLTFYYKRIKRILPLYYMVLFAVLILVVVKLPAFRSINFTSSRRALLLIANIKFETDPVKEYERMLKNANDLLTHTWSLCVEMQWYLLAPPLFFLQSLLLPKTIFFLGIAYASMHFYFIVDDNTAFYNVLARMWQFCAGIIAFVHSDDKTCTTQTYQLTESEDSLQEKGKLGCTDVISWLIFVLAVMVPFVWIPLPKRFLRIETTIMTAILIRLGKRHQTAILIRQEVMYVGEISYALYLIHWPVLVVMNYWYPEDPLSLMRQLNAAETPGGQHLWHEDCTYSARFLKMSAAPFGLCTMKKGNGTVDMLVAGNSFACNQGDLIYNAYKAYARNFHIFCVSGCELFSPICQLSFNFTQIVEELKPDVVFLIERAILMKTPFNVKQPIDRNKNFGLYMKLLRYLEKKTKKIYILQALPSCVPYCSAKAMLYLKNGKALSTIKDGLIVRDEYFARHRIWELSKRCKKCEIVDYMPMLVDKKGQYLGYNPITNLMYLDEENHFNRFGKQTIQPIFEKLAKQFVIP